MSVLKVDTPSDLQKNIIYQICEQHVWIIKYACQRSKSGSRGSNHPPRITYGNGFVYNGLLVTTWHSIPQEKNLVIKARPLTENGFHYEAKLVHKRKEWDFALLKIQDLQDGNRSTCTMPSDCSLYEGQPLIFMGGSSVSSQDINVGSFRLGRVAYRCVNDMNFPEVTHTCADHQRNFFDLVPEYRVLGDVCNITTISSDNSTTDSFIYHDNSVIRDDKAASKIGIQNCLCTILAEVPLIHMSCECCVPRSSGCPVFNDKSEIVGMMVFSQVDGHAFAIHSSLLKRALEEYLGKGKGTGKGREKEEDIYQAKSSD